MARRRNSEGNGTWITGVTGKALRLDGASGQVSIPDEPALSPSNLTISAWVKPEKTGTQYIVKKAETDATDGTSSASPRPGSRSSASTS